MKSLSLLSIALGALVFLAPASQARTIDKLHFASGQTKTNCHLVEVVGDHLTYRCPREGATWFNQNVDTATRLTLAGGQDQLTLKSGETLTGQLVFKDYERYDIKTEEGLRRIQRRQVKAVEMGLATPVDAAPPIQLPPAYDDRQSPEGVAPATSSAAPVESYGQLIADNDVPQEEAQPDTPEPESYNSQPVTSSQGNEAPPVRKVRERKPIRRLVTPMTSPWKNDKPYDSNSVLY